MTVELLPIHLFLGKQEMYTRHNQFNQNRIQKSAMSINTVIKKENMYKYYTHITIN